MKKNTRQLAAIMFTDMVGYTALMQVDERQAKAQRDRHRQAFVAATEAYQQNLARNPASALAYQGYATFLLVEEKYAEAIAAMARAPT